MDVKEDSKVLKMKIDKIFSELTQIKVKQAELHIKTAFWAAVGFVLLSSMLGYIVTLIGDLIKNSHHAGG